MTSIAEGNVVEIEYTLTDAAGNVIDTSEGDKPLAYLHGHGNIIPGLEKELLGKKVGDNFKVSIPPAEGYGDRDESLVQEVDKGMFQVEGGEVTVGMQFSAETQEGELLVVVTEISDEHITVDANHPLAGETLDFTVEVKSIRAATEEELKHGHAH